MSRLGVAPLHLEAGGYLKSLGSSSPSFGGQRFSVSRLGVVPFIWRSGLPVNSLGVALLHLEAGGYL